MHQLRFCLASMSEQQRPLLHATDILQAGKVPIPLPPLSVAALEGRAWRLINMACNFCTGASQGAGGSCREAARSRAAAALVGDRAERKHRPPARFVPHPSLFCHSLKVSQLIFRRVFSLTRASHVQRHVALESEQACHSVMFALNRIFRAKGSQCP